LGTINRYVFEVCPSCGIAHLDQDRLRHDRYAFALLAVALGAHCFLDGMAVAAGSGIDGRAGFGLTLGVLLHKLPEGFALALLLVNAGCGAWSALWRCAAVQSVTLAGGLVGMAVLGPATPKSFMGATFAFVGGGFVFLVANAVRGVLARGTDHKARVEIGIQVASFAVTGLFLSVICGRLI
jgi:zinc transporter ZupT